MTIVINAGRLEKKRKEMLRTSNSRDRNAYFQNIAQARFVLRKVFRLIEEQAKKSGLESLEHQALIQIYGSPEMKLRVKEVAERIDVDPAFASIVLKSLTTKGFVTRLRDVADQRVVFVAATAKGREVLHHIDEQVQSHVDYFTRTLDSDAREAAISILMFYVGISLDQSLPARGKSLGL